MRPNRSIPAATVIPELGYHDLPRAVAWLCATYGFSVRLTIAEHRAQLNVADGAIVVTGTAPGRAASTIIMVRVDDVDSHFARTLAAGADILRPPTSYPYGERQYTTRDVGGHLWTFSQTIADVAPESWGGALAG